jgi:hypothetical protein
MSALHASVLQKALQFLRNFARNMQLQFKLGHIDLFHYFYLAVLTERDWKMIVGCFKLLSCIFEQILMTTMKDDSNVNERILHTGSQVLPYTILIHAPSVPSFI